MNFVPQKDKQLKTQLKNMMQNQQQQQQQQQQSKNMIEKKEEKNKLVVKIFFSDEPFTLSYLGPWIGSIFFFNLKVQWSKLKYLEKQLPLKKCTNSERIIKTLKQLKS